ncbi:MAG: N-acetyltransferase [Planctomycetes bacterium]|nr:N-acetyltransferase [Planctomycetota bacterium]
MLRKAVVEDVEKIQKLVNHFASKDEMLPRSLSEIYENIRDFFVYIEDGEIVGCAALHVFWKDLAELKSIAVFEQYQRQGIGSVLTRECIEDAKRLGITKLFVLTYIPKFFEHLGFTVVLKDSLPHKIWSECVKCHKFPDCGEVPLILEIKKIDNEVLPR